VSLSPNIIQDPATRKKSSYKPQESKEKHSNIILWGCKIGNQRKNRQEITCLKQNSPKREKEKKRKGSTRNTSSILPIITLQMRKMFYLVQKGEEKTFLCRKKREKNNGEKNGEKGDFEYHVLGDDNARIDRREHKRETSRGICQGQGLAG